jgi:hypothetical protein
MSIPAGIVGDRSMLTLVALIHMAAEKCRAAVFDGVKNADVRRVQQMAEFCNELVSMSADHIGHLA